METHEFTCPDCGARIDLDGPGLEATLAYGCPLCGRAVGADHLGSARRREV